MSWASRPPPPQFFYVQGATQVIKKQHNKLEMFLLWARIAHKELVWEPKQTLVMKAVRWEFHWVSENFTGFNYKLGKSWRFETWNMGKVKLTEGIIL